LIEALNLLTLSHKKAISIKNKTASAKNDLKKLFKSFFNHLKKKKYSIIRDTKAFKKRIRYKIRKAPKQLTSLSKSLSQTGIIMTIALILLSILSYKYNLPNGYIGILYIIYFLLLFVLKIDSRIPVSAALFLLILTPFFLIKNLEAYANYLATLAYFFLVIGVVKQFVEYIKTKEE